MTKAERLLQKACRYRDNLYLEDKKKWTKASKLFEQAVKALDEDGEDGMVYYTKPFIKHCLKRAEIS